MTDGLQLTVTTVPLLVVDTFDGAVDAFDRTEAVMLAVSEQPVASVMVNGQRISLLA